MVTYIHGKGAAFLHGSYDLSPWTTDVSTSEVMTPADTSHFGSVSKTYIVGQNDGTATFSGLYDGTQTPLSSIGSNDIFMTAIAAEKAAVNLSTAITLGMEGISLGAAAILGCAKHTTYKIATVVSDVNKITGDIQFTGGVTGGNFLLGTGPQTATALLPSFDSGVGVVTTLGARAHLHVLSNTLTGTLVVKIQHSTDNSTWVDLQTFTTILAATIGSEEIVIAPQTINRYIRATTTIGGTGSAVLPIAFARN